MAGRRLAALLGERIRQEGPIGIDRFMAEALGHPQLGYYTTRDPLGAGGDFTTAPEISQMFGELIGLWSAVVWQAMGSPARVVLAELGPGRGTLMADLLRAAASVPPFRAALDVHLVETSPVLRDRQRQALEGQALEGRAVAWADRIEDLPPGPLLLVANEFFDALPIRQYQRQGGIWRERLVGRGRDGGLAFVTGPEAEPPLPAEILTAPDGAILEECPEGRRIAAQLGRRLATWGGAALIVDYGHGRSAAGDTLQAVKRHRFHPVLQDPGSADITAHVDFEALARAAMPARAWGPLAQGDFLRRLGIEARAAALGQGGEPAKVYDIMERMRRLIDPAEMGTLFKAMGLAHPALPLLPGFEA